MYDGVVDCVATSICNIET